MDEQELVKKQIVQKEESVERTDRLELLKGLETWGEEQGEELQDKKQRFSGAAITFQTRLDEQMTNKMKAMVPSVSVTSSAPVPLPPQTAPAAKEGYKARREREKKRKEALKVCPVGDEYTLDTVRGISDVIRCREASSTPEISKLAHATHTDFRIPKMLCSDYKLDKKGRPATDEDEAIMLKNRKFLSDYASGDAQLRKPYLDEIVDRILNAKFTPDMLTPGNITKNAVSYKHLGDLFTCVDNLQTENPEYFASLPKIKKDLLDAQTKIGVPFTHAFIQAMNARGIDSNMAEVFSDSTPIEMGKMLLGDAVKDFSASFKVRDDETADAYKNEVDRQTEQELSELKPAYAKQDELLKKEYGVSFPDGASELQYSDMKKFRDMIADHPKEYEQNQALIDMVFSNFYKTLSQIGEKTLVVRARQGVVDNNASQTDDFQRAISGRALDIVEELGGNIGKLSNYGNSLMDIMEHFLRGKPLLGSAVSVMEQIKKELPHDALN